MMDDVLDGLLDELVAVEPREAWADVLRRARRSRRRYIAIAVALATLVLAPSAWAIQRALSGKHYVPSYAPRAQQVVDLSWLNGAHGWALLGRTCPTYRDRCAAVEETANGGASWEQLASIPAEIGAGSNGGLSGYGGFCAEGHACVAHLLFVTARVGYAYGPSLFLTTDGGKTWTQDSSQPVETMAASGSNVFRIVYAHTGCPGPCSPQLQEATIGRDAWAPVPAEIGAGNGAGETIYAASRNLYIFSWGNIAAGVTSHADIKVSRDGGQSWSAIADPCGSSAHKEWDAAAASAVSNQLGVLCLPKSGGHPFVALSNDAGRTFATGRPLPVNAAEQIAINGSGTVAVGNAGITGGGPFTYTLATSQNAGRTWTIAVRDRHQVAINLASGVLQFVSPRDLAWVGYPYSLWQSHNSGRAWQQTHLAPQPANG